MRYELMLNVEWTGVPTETGINNFQKRNSSILIFVKKAGIERIIMQVLMKHHLQSRSINFHSLMMLYVYVNIM